MLSNIGIDLSFNGLKVFDASCVTVLSLPIESGVPSCDQVISALPSCIDAHIAKSEARYDGVNVSVSMPAELLAGPKKEAVRQSIEDCLMGRSATRLIKVSSHAAANMYDMMHNIDGSQCRDVVYAKMSVGIISVESKRIELSGTLFGKAATTLMVSEHCGARIYTDDYIADYVDAAWGKTAKMLDRVIVAGAEAQRISLALAPMFGNRLWVPSDPFISAARGLYKNAISTIKKSIQ